MSAEGAPLTATRLAADIEAARQDFEVIQSDVMTLLLDLDTPEALAQYMRVLPKVMEHYNVVSTTSWLSKSGNTHIQIRLGEALDLSERIALQAALGSDGVKEVLSLRRMQNGCVEPCLLFKPRASNAQG